MNRVANLAERATLSGVALSALLIAGCQSTKTEPVQEPVAATKPAAAPAPAPAPAPEPVNLGSNPNCPVPVIAKSPEAVADPCMTTDKFIDSIAALSNQQKADSRQLVAASDQLMAKLGVRLAH